MISIRYRRALVCVGLLFSSRAASQQPVRIDDANAYSLTNPNGIQFGSNGWNKINPSSNDPHYNGTYTSSQTVDSNLVFFFQVFYGCSKRVVSRHFHYALRGQWSKSWTCWSIDRWPTYENATWTNVGNVQYKQWMWKTTDLSPGDHQIVVSNVGTGDPATTVLFRPSRRLCKGARRLRLFGYV
ncbi:hypothetical protein BDV93DRAFT_510753 [Ceratobasidium sp. AG-I]|nr:hypothetical protein BDV93DRAFT_510753 [Ceratobasidium sp. AG-I]